MAKSSAVREEGAGGVGGLSSEEKMLWSLPGSCAEASSFSLKKVVLADVTSHENLERRVW